MKKYAFIFTLTWLMIGFNLTQVEAQVEEIEPVRGLYYYSGTLGQEDKIEFNLQFNGNLVSGSYLIEETGDMFVFSGRMAEDKNGIGVLVYNVDNLYVASIEATFTSEESNFGKMLTGKWKSVNGNQNKTLKLKKVAEFAQGPSIPSVLENTYGE